MGKVGTMRNKLMSIANEVRESVFVVCHESHNVITKQALGTSTTNPWIWNYREIM